LPSLSVVGELPRDPAVPLCGRNNRRARLSRPNHGEISLLSSRGKLQRAGQSARFVIAVASGFQQRAAREASACSALPGARKGGSKKNELIRRAAKFSDGGSPSFTIRLFTLSSLGKNGERTKGIQKKKQKSKSKENREAERHIRKVNRKFLGFLRGCALVPPPSKLAFTTELRRDQSSRKRQMYDDKKL
jgi:hypothetical protein